MRMQRQGCSGAGWQLQEEQGGIPKQLGCREQQALRLQSRAQATRKTLVELENLIETPPLPRLFVAAASAAAAVVFAAASAFSFAIAALFARASAPPPSPAWPRGQHAPPANHPLVLQQLWRCRHHPVSG